MLVATQYTAGGYMVSGLPGRATIEVVASAAPSQSQAGAKLSAAPDETAPATSWLGGIRPAGRDPVAAAIALLSLAALTLVVVARTRHGARHRTARLAA
jgi:hypothetical protein